MALQDRASEAYNIHLPAAQALADEAVLPYRLDADVAIINVNHGVRILEGLRTEIPVHLPRIPLPELECLADLALAVKFAAISADQAFPAGASAKDMITEGWALRKMLMPQVKAFAAAKTIPQTVYDRIVRGSGIRDMASDCVALAKVFYDYAAAVAGKHPFEPAVITRAEIVGSWLLQNLSKQTAAQPVDRLAAYDIRDRMATLLVMRHEQLQVVAHYFLGKNYAEHVPPLMSRKIVTAPEEETEPKPEPAPPSGSTPEPSKK